MFELLDKLKLNFRQFREQRQLKKEKHTEFLLLENNRKYANEQLSLERDLEVETVRAKIRKQQAIAVPKNGQKLPEKKSMFDGLQNIADNFVANQERNGGSILGPITTGGLNGRKTKGKKNT